MTNADLNSSGKTRLPIENLSPVLFSKFVHYKGTCINDVRFWGGGGDKSGAIMSEIRWERSGDRGGGGGRDRG